MRPVPPPGETATAFRIPVRVYFQDTDAGGIVYHARYLDYFERCRMDWLRACHGPVSRLAVDSGVLFIVRAVAIEYLAPARLDDDLEVSLAPADVRGAQLDLRQQVVRADTLLVDGRVQLACVSAAHLRPTRIPPSLRDSLSSRGSTHPSPACT
ncbi:MAG: tol-pal system-associated acyl-CoA thioesterase [Betaproteobacteria bacterium]|nr:tol-pal system-associated acyl-CoA thioesterase [Betaproteobacteria bacterium]